MAHCVGNSPVDEGMPFLHVLNDHLHGPGQYLSQHLWWMQFRGRMHAVARLAQPCWLQAVTFLVAYAGTLRCVLLTWSQVTSLKHLRQGSSSDSVMS